MTTEIRQLSLPEVADLLLWAKAEGWNPGIDDAAAFHAADPHGFLGCFVDGRMAAGISAVASGPDFGFIGLYICHPDLRGRGLGRHVWDAGMSYLGSRTIGLDGVPEPAIDFSAYLDDLAFERSFDTMRMYRGPAPVIDMAGVFGVTTLELG